MKTRSVVLTCACLAVTLLAGCEKLAERELSRYPTHRSNRDLDTEERLNLIKELYIQAAEFDKSMWNAARGDELRDAIERLRNNEDVIIYYDSEDRPRALKIGWRKVTLKAPAESQ